LGDLYRSFGVARTIKRIRDREHQTLETLINKEDQLSAKYLSWGS